MVTTNEALMSKLWETYLNLPEDQVVLMYEKLVLQLLLLFDPLGPR